MKGRTEKKMGILRLSLLGSEFEDDFLLQYNAV
jgi:hypothetical protein